MKLLNNKIAVVTGGTGGIGKSIVKTFVKNGAKVIFTFFSSEKESEKLKNEFKYNLVESYHIDLSKSEKYSKVLIEYVIKKYGNIDILVNNAGVIRDNLLIKTSQEDWDYVIKTNLYSVFNLTKHVVYPMLKQRQGSIINMTSIVGLIGNYGQSNYASSKAGIIGFTKSISKEFGSKNIRCNAIAPGYISTNINAKINLKIKENWIKKISLKRFGFANEVANCALFLASDLSSYVTGSILHVNGGII